MMQWILWAIAVMWWCSCTVAVQAPLLTMEGILPAFGYFPLFLSDIVLLCMGAVLCWTRLFKSKESSLPSVFPQGKTLLALLVGLLALLSCWAVFPFFHWLTLARFLLFGFVFVGLVDYYPRFWKILGITFLGYVALQGGIAWIQVLGNQSIGLSLLGESMLQPDMYNVATVSFFGSDRLRGYGLFVHPNILGAYSAIGVLLVHICMTTPRWKRLWTGILFLAGVASFSKAFLVATLLCLLLFSVKGVGLRPLALRMSILVGSLLLVSPFIWGWGFIWERWIQWESAWRAFVVWPWGGGFGSASWLQDLGSATLLAPWEAQPVHNVIMLALLEWTILGVSLLCLLWWKALNAVRYVARSYRTIVLGLLTVLAVFGMVDHFWITLYEGQLLLVYVCVWLMYLFQQPMRKGVVE